MSRVPVNKDWRSLQDRNSNPQEEEDFDELTKDNVRGHRDHKKKSRDKDKKDRKWDDDFWN